MKNIIRTIVILLVFTVTSNIQGQAYESAVGARLGTFFTGTYKTFIGENTALEGVAGFDRVGGGSIGGVSYGGATVFVLGAFYEIHNELDLDGTDFQWYYGFGGYIGLGSGGAIVPSGIIGLEYTMEDSPVCFFIDAIPGIAIASGGSDFQMNGSLGARYILNR